MIVELLTVQEIVMVDGGAVVLQYVQQTEVLGAHVPTGTSSQILAIEYDDYYHPAEYTEPPAVRR